MNLRVKSHLVCLIFMVVVHFSLTGQITKGQILVNGNASFFSNHSIVEQGTSARLIDGETIPALSYQQKQDLYNFTFAPKAHYFLSEKWSIGLGFGLRRIVNDRYLPSILASELPTHIAFFGTTKNKSTTYSYAPQLEFSRHWNINKRLAISLTAFAGWQLVTIKQESSTPVNLTTIADLTEWTVSEDGQRFTPQNKNIETTNRKDHFWKLGVNPQLRYGFTSRFGVTVIIGRISVAQKVKSTEDSFIKAAPDLTFSINPTSWIWGIYYVFGEKVED